MENNNFKTWGERLFFPKKIKRVKVPLEYRLIDLNKPFRAFNFYNKGYGSTRSTKALKARLNRIVRRTPEVMVKITSTGHSSKTLKKHLDYISRDGDISLINEQGERINNKMAKEEIEMRWGHDLTESGLSKYAESYHLVFSMPAGTPRDDFRVATEETIRKLFNGHQFYYAEHNDTEHPHIHVAVKALDIEGKRLGTKKADLHKWRTVYAQILRSHGLQAEASKRVHRAKILKADKTSLYQLKKRGGKAKFDSKQKEEQFNKVQKGSPYKDSKAVLAARKSRYAVINIYNNLVNELSKSNQELDKKLAEELKTYVKQMKSQSVQQQNYYNLAKAELTKANKLKAQLEKQNRIKTKEKDLSIDREK